MANEIRLVNANKLFRWLEIMLDGMAEYSEEEYTVGAAKAYDTVIVIELGVFDIKEIKN